MSFLGGSPSCYNVANSIGLDGMNGRYLTKLLSTSDAKIFTVSFWIKRTTLGTTQSIFSTAKQSNFDDSISFNTSDQLVLLAGHATSDWSISTSRVFKDIGSWYHIVVAVNTTQTVPAKIYVNGELDPATLAVYQGSTLNYTFGGFNQGIETHSIGCRQSFNADGGHGVYSTLYYLDGYLSEFYFIDGTALDPTYFARTCPLYGQWEPKKYNGIYDSYGSNGFYLEFKNGAALGTDTSGHANTWTAAGGITSANQYYDTPTNNFPTLNSLYSETGFTTATIRKCGLEQTGGGAGVAFAPSTVGISSGKWYFEATWTSMTNGSVGAGSGFAVSIKNDTAACIFSSDKNVEGLTGAYVQIDSTVGDTTSGRVAQGLPAWNANDVIGCSFDLGNKKIMWYVNGVAISGSDYTFTSTGVFLVAAWPRGNSVGTVQLNYGQRPFVYTPPTGYKAICTKNLPTPIIKRAYEYFNPKLYQGGGATKAVSIGFSPNLTWIKSRSSVSNHTLFDTERQVSNYSPATTYDTAGTRNFIVPAGVTSITLVDAHGAGGGGGGIGSTNSEGGGGGAWARSGDVAVSPGDIIVLTTGAGGAGGWLGTLGVGSAGGETSVYNQTTNTYLLRLSGGGGAQNAGAGVGTGGYVITNLFGGFQGSGNDGLPIANSGWGGASDEGTGGLQLSYLPQPADSIAPTKGGGGGGERSANSGGQYGAAGYISISYLLSGSFIPYLSSNNTAAQVADPNSLTSFEPLGFNLGNSAAVNAASTDFISWNWKEGIVPGFDIVEWTGNGGTNQRISHNLGVFPKFIIAKAKAATSGWGVWHVGLSNTDTYLELEQSAASRTLANMWGIGNFTSSDFGVGAGGTGSGVNLSPNEYIGYIFADVEGFSKFGTYVGNGLDNGPFVYCGFRPAFILTKCTTLAGTGWTIESKELNVLDDNRVTYNDYIHPNSNNFANSNGTQDYTLHDWFSNGFKARYRTANQNLNGHTYIYAAFAEFPFKYANAR